MRSIVSILLLAGLTASGEPAPRDAESIRAGLLAPSRGARQQAEAAAREWARTDPAGVAALWEGLDLPGRCHLVRALAAAGTRHAAGLALKLAGGAESEVFQALLVGIVEGGARSVTTPLPEDLPARRRAALEALRLRWRVEAELVRLKSPTGPTGHYTGQYERIRALGPDVIPIFFDIALDRARPLPGEGAAGPYRSLHPGMVRFEHRELRSLSAYAFAEIVPKDDADTIVRLTETFYVLWNMDGETNRFEKEDLAPAIGYSLHDLGVKQCALVYLKWLEVQARDYTMRGLSAKWDLGYANIRLGNYAEGERYYQEILAANGVNRAIAAYNLACNFSTRAKREPRHRPHFVRRALDYLEMAVEQFNYGDWVWMEEDGDLDFIRKQPRYQALLAHLKKKYPARAKGKVGKKREDFLPGKK